MHYAELKIWGGISSLFWRQCCWLAVLVISRLHLSAFSFSTGMMCCPWVFRKLPPSQSWNMQSYHWPIYLCHVLYYTCALNYICLNVCTSEQPDLDRAAPESGKSIDSYTIVLIRGWLCSLPVNILTCLVSVTYSLCSVCHSSLCKSGCFRERFK